MRRFILLLYCSIMFSSLQAQVYEWFDASGTRHFSDQKPTGVEYRELGEPGETLSTYRPAATRIPVAPPASSGVDNAGARRAPRSARSAAEPDLESICNRYLRRIDDIHDRLRAGYGEPQGNRMRAQRSALRRAYQRDCN